MYDDGFMKIYRLQDVAPAGEMPQLKLVYLQGAFFESRVIGYGRFYAAKGAQQQIDLLLRAPEHLPGVRIGMFAVLEDGLQYRIDNVQHTTDDDELPVTDLSLFRLEEFFDVAE